MTTLSLNCSNKPTRMNEVSPSFFEILAYISGCSRFVAHGSILLGKDKRNSAEKVTKKTLFELTRHFSKIEILMIIPDYFSKIKILRGIPGCSDYSSILSYLSQFHPT